MGRGLAEADERRRARLREALMVVAVAEREAVER
jgi:hypothetical protein